MRKNKHESKELIVCTLALLVTFSAVGLFALSRIANKNPTDPARQEEIESDQIAPAEPDAGSSRSEHETPVDYDDKPSAHPSDSALLPTTEDGRDGNAEAIENENDFSPSQADDLSYDDIVHGGRIGNQIIIGTDVDDSDLDLFLLPGGLPEDVTAESIRQYVKLALQRESNLKVESVSFAAPSVARGESVYGTGTTWIIDYECTSIDGRSFVLTVSGFTSDKSTEFDSIGSFIRFV